MNSAEIFSLAFGLSNPWSISNIEFSQKNNKRTLIITIGYNKEADIFKKSSGNSRFYDHQPKRWRHLNFFEHQCYIQCNVPRLIDEKTNKITQMEVPWARAQSGFTLLFEAYSMALIGCEMPVNKAGKLLNEYPKRLWTIFNYWIGIAYSEADHSQIKKVAFDETSTKKGHSYMTLGVDIENGNVFHATPGKDKETITQMANYLKTKNCDINKIESICSDLSPAFISGITTQFENATLVFDRFHVKQLLNKAMDEVRKRDRALHKEELKGCKYIFLKNEENLSKEQRYIKNNLINLLPNIGEAYRLKELFDTFWEIQDEENAKAFLWYWCDLAKESKIQPMIKFSNTVVSHWTGITNYINTKISNGLIEGINSKIQLAKRRARGYSNINNFINMVYFIAGKLKYNHPVFNY